MTCYKHQTLLILLFLSFTLAKAQQSELKHYRDQNYLDLGISIANQQFATALSAYHLHGLGHKKQRFKIGYGIRLTSFVAANKYYTTAPSKFTSTEQSLGTLFSETIEKNIDTITTATASTNSLNLALYFEYALNSRFDIGFNIDAVGVSAGSQKKFTIISSAFDANQEPVQTGSPTKFNLLLTSDNDRGSLNSEFYLRYWFTTKLGIKIGYTFLFSEYQTDQKISFDHGRIVNDRYRLKSSMALLSVSFRPFSH